jgi:hypothetical protein
MEAMAGGTKLVPLLLFSPRKRCLVSGLLFYMLGPSGQEGLISSS